VICAVEAGADMTGFVFAESPRQLTVERACELTALVPSSVKKVGVFVDSPQEDVNRIIETCGLDFVQLHGDETPGYCASFGEKAIKAFRVSSLDDLEVMKEFSCDIFLLDSFDPHLKGGTGKMFDSEIACEAEKYGKIIMAGGLTVDNISETVAKVHPWGVDVSSGVEIEKGIKGHELIRSFIQLAKEAS
jgi:phosphoribosylanthranilate isomerase